METATAEIMARLGMARTLTLRFGQDAIHCAAIAGLAQESMINVTDRKRAFWTVFSKGIPLDGLHLRSVRPDAAGVRPQWLQRPPAPLRPALRFRRRARRRNSEKSGDRLDRLGR